MTESTNHQWLLGARPVGAIKDSDFRWNEAPIPEPGEGEFLVRTVYLSVDPTMRGWMTDLPSYIPPVALGEVMRAYGAGRVVKSNDPGFPVGTLVNGMLGWQDYALGGGPSAAMLNMTAVPPGVSLPNSLSVFNITGYSAYFGLLDIGQPQAGDTVVVSGAAGAVGSIAGQIAKIKGCRVVGVAGSDEKCAWVVNELGFDACINYRTEHVARRLHELCPNGIDVYFDNVGGETLDASLGQINLRARVVLCGRISVYNETGPAPGPANYSRLIPMRGRMEGFIVVDYASRFAEAAAEMGRWMAAGRLKSREEFVDGLENAPRALRMLFEGGNTGKLLVRVSQEQG